MTSKKTQVSIALVPLAITLVSIGSWLFASPDATKPEEVEPQREIAEATIPRLQHFRQYPIASINDETQAVYAAEETTTSPETSPRHHVTSSTSPQSGNSNSKPHSDKRLLSAELKQLLKTRMP